MSYIPGRLPLRWPLVNSFSPSVTAQWPDVPSGESAFIHRLAVRRAFAGGAVSTALLNWAIERARKLDKKFLRLDCEASRSRLRAVYERFGFRHHSDRKVGPYRVARYEFSLAQHR